MCFVVLHVVKPTDATPDPTFVNTLLMISLILVAASVIVKNYFVRKAALTAKDGYWRISFMLPLMFCEAAALFGVVVWVRPDLQKRTGSSYLDWPECFFTLPAAQRKPSGLSSRPRQTRPPTGWTHPSPNNSPTRTFNALAILSKLLTDGFLAPTSIPAT